MVHRQRRAGQAAEEGGHFTLRQEAGRTFREAVRRRATQLRLEDGQRAANAVAANVHGAARFGKADQRHQNMMQAERQQQAFSGTEDHRAKIAGAIDNVAQSVDTHREHRPHQRNDQPDQA